MDLELSDEQRLLLEMVERFATDAGGLEPHRVALESEVGYSCQTWQKMAELGLLSILFTEEIGGLGGGGTELMIIGESMGRHMIATPFLETAVVAATILAGNCPRAQDPLIDGLLNGTQIYALVEKGIELGPRGLSGTAIGIAAGGQADRLIVAAGGAIYSVDATSSAISREDYPLHGGGRAADIRLSGAKGDLIADKDTAEPLLRRAADRRVVFLASEALGAAEAAFEATVDYLKTRVQFGTPIGANQSLQHRAAELFVEIEQLRSAVILAACSLDELDTAKRARGLAAATIVVAKVARFVGQWTVQLHGGIGVADEHAVGHWFLRLTAINLLLDSRSSVDVLVSEGRSSANLRTSGS